MAKAKERSFFIYIHKDMAQDPSWTKCGKAMTPYSAVRARQKFTSVKFTLDHLYVGQPSDIDRLEDLLKTRFKNFSGKSINGFSAQTEMFKKTQDQVVDELNTLIQRYNLDVYKVQLDEPYSASSSGECPFGMPPETRSHEFMERLMEEYFEKGIEYFKEESPNIGGSPVI